MTPPLGMVERAEEPQATEPGASPDKAGLEQAPPALASSDLARQVSHRYSRFVAMMKVALPALAVALVGAVALWPQLRDLGDDGFSVSFADIDRLISPQQKLVNARYYGTDGDNQPFTITADMAEETEPGSTMVRLDNPKADITLEDGAWIMLGANKGVYSQNDEVLDLLGEVDLFHDAGYELHTTAATVDMAQGAASGDRPVRSQGPFGNLTAEGFRLTEAGRRIEFTGRARLLLRPTAAPPPQQTKALEAPG